MLILEPTKIYQPSYVSINNEAEEKNVSIWHVSPAETVRMKYNIVTPAGEVGVWKHIKVHKARNLNIPQALLKEMEISYLPEYQPFLFRSNLFHSKLGVWKRTEPPPCGWKRVKFEDLVLLLLLHRLVVYFISPITLLWASDDAFNMSVNVKNEILLLQKGIHEWNFTAMSIKGIR